MSEPENPIKFYTSNSLRIAFGPVSFPVGSDVATIIGGSANVTAAPIGGGSVIPAMTATIVARTDGEYVEAFWGAGSFTEGVWATQCEATASGQTVTLRATKFIVLPSL